MNSSPVKTMEKIRMDKMENLRQLPMLVEFIVQQLEVAPFTEVENFEKNFVVKICLRCDRIAAALAEIVLHAIHTNQDSDLFHWFVSCDRFYRKHYEDECVSVVILHAVLHKKDIPEGVIPCKLPGKISDGIEEACRTKIVDRMIRGWQLSSLTDLPTVLFKRNEEEYYFFLKARKIDEEDRLCRFLAYYWGLEQEDAVDFKDDTSHRKSKKAPFRTRNVKTTSIYYMWIKKGCVEKVRNHFQFVLPTNLA